jgi:hypothetical protein
MLQLEDGEPRRVDGKVVPVIDYPYAEVASPPSKPALSDLR